MPLGKANHNVFDAGNAGGEGFFRHSFSQVCRNGNRLKILLSTTWEFWGGSGGGWLASGGGHLSIKAMKQRATAQRPRKMKFQADLAPSEDRTVRLPKELPTGTIHGIKKALGLK